jgi:hypothetical protein
MTTPWDVRHPPELPCRVGLAVGLAGAHVAAVGLVAWPLLVPGLLVMWAGGAVVAVNGFVWLLAREG